MFVKAKTLKDSWLQEQSLVLPSQPKEAHLKLNLRWYMEAVHPFFIKGFLNSFTIDFDLDSQSWFFKNVYREVKLKKFFKFLPGPSLVK